MLPCVLLRRERLWLQSRIRKVVDSKRGWQLVFVGYHGAATCACDPCRARPDRVKGNLMPVSSLQSSDSCRFVLRCLNVFPWFSRPPMAWPCRLLWPPLHLSPPPPPSCAVLLSDPRITCYFPGQRVHGPVCWGTSVLTAESCCRFPGLDPQCPKGSPSYRRS